MTESNPTHHEAPAGGAVEVRRNVPLAAAVGTIAGLLTIAFAVRTLSGHGNALDWFALAVLVLITIAYAVTLLDARAPLMVVDDRGVRLRDGSKWQGIAWPDVDCMEHLPRRLPFRDGHLLVVGHDDEQLVVPLTLATRVVGVEGGTISDTLADLAAGRADVVEVVPGIDEDAPAEPHDHTDPVLPAAAPQVHDDFFDQAAVPAGGAHAAPAEPEDTVDLSEQSRPATGAHVAEPTVAVDVLGVVEPVDAVDADLEDATDTGEIPAVSETDAQAEADAEADTQDLSGFVSPTPMPGRSTVLAARVELDGTPRPTPEPLVPADRPDPLDPNTTVVLEDLAVHPATLPVVGPQLASARNRLGLTIDKLSERTRIRPHVIEAIESDDFGPCGGDFYARGHLRTLSRVLGIDAGPLVRLYDDTYADAPVDPRRVFESELATGHGGTIRGTRGGRNWSVLIAAVMGAVLVWSVARLVLGGPAPMGDTPILNQSGGIARSMNATGDPVKVVLVAQGGGAHVVVRDANGRVVLDGPLAFGQTANLKAVAPVRVQSSDGSVTVSIDGKPAKPLGKTGEEASSTFIAR